MAELKTIVEKKERLGVTPYEDLYIYVLNGPVRKDEETFFGEGFMENWIEEDSSFLFFQRPADNVIASLLKMRTDLDLINDYHLSYEQWQGGSLSQVKIADFVIIPAWEKVEGNEEEIKIVLDPGVVFGNGLHPTTSGCLRAISFAKKHRPLNKVLDLGTGTGVLALAAAFLGAERVFAIDLNPLCVKTATNNVRLNDLDNIVKVAEGSAEEFVNKNADLLVANVHYAVIQMILDKRDFRNKDRLILSGLMRSQFRDTKVKLERSNFRILHEWDYDMIWSTLLAERN